jgi:hypothetical protein
LGAQGTQSRKSRCAVEIFQSRTNQVIPEECTTGGDCPKGDLCELDFDPILGAQDFDEPLNFKLHITETTPPQTGRFEVSPDGKWELRTDAVLPVPLDLSGRKSEKVKAGFLFALEFDAAGKWKIVKTHQMSEKEVEEIEKGE